MMIYRLLALLAKYPRVLAFLTSVLTWLNSRRYQGAHRK